MRARYWVLALPLAGLVLTFCVSVAAPAPEHGPPCGGLDPSEHVCAQSGAPLPVLAVVQELPLAQTTDPPSVAVSAAGAPARPPQHYADLAPPRPPPDRS